jgi:hypothetical protein
VVQKMPGVGDSVQKDPRIQMIVLGVRNVVVGGLILTRHSRSSIHLGNLFCDTRGYITIHRQFQIQKTQKAVLAWQH